MRPISTALRIKDSKWNKPAYRWLALALMALSGSAQSANFPFGNEYIITSSDYADNLYFAVNGIQIDGDTIVASGLYGADHTASAVYVFEYNSGSNSWVETQKIPNPDPQAFDAFGAAESMALQGDTLLIGDWYQNEEKGAVFVYQRDNATRHWNLTQKFTPSDAVVKDYFGTPIAIDGDTVIIGSRDKAYVYHRSHVGTWIQQQLLQPSDTPVGFAYIGIDVHGDKAAIGAMMDNDWAGSAYVFERDSGGIWHEVQKLYPHNPAIEDQFGHAVAIYANTLAIGSKGTTLNSGYAYIFNRNADGTWTESQQLIPTTTVSDARFGEYLDMQNDETIIVGARGDGVLDTGSVYLFAKDRTSGAWSQKQKLTPSDGTPDQQFGEGVAISGNRVITGTYKSKLYVYESLPSSHHEEEAENEHEHEDEHNDDTSENEGSYGSHED